MAADCGPSFPPDVLDEHFHDFGGVDHEEHASSTSLDVISVVIIAQHEPRQFIATLEPGCGLPTFQKRRRRAAPDQKSR
jgi:hypothetical protein